MTVDLGKLSRELERDEGVQLKPYRCTKGKLTIGVGRNIDDIGLSKSEIEILLTYGIPREYSSVLLRNDITRVLAECRSQPWWNAVADDDVRARVLLNMCFNLGLARLSGFRKMLAAVQRQDWETAAVEMVDSAWYGQVGNRSKRLVSMMRTGRDQ